MMARELTDREVRFDHITGAHAAVLRGDAPMPDCQMCRDWLGNNKPRKLTRYGRYGWDRK